MRPWGSAGLAVLTLLIAVQLCAGYKCYICSWSPASPNRTDICTRENFNRDAVKVYEGCPHGCESVAAYDLNGELENFYRNCVVKGKKVENDCKEETNRSQKKTICRCDSDLCNAAPASSSTALIVALAAATATIGLVVRG